MQYPEQQQAPGEGATNPVPTVVAKLTPHKIYLERVGWRIMLEKPGRPRSEIAHHVDKMAATSLAADAAQVLANELGETVELHTQDAKGRPSGTRYFDRPPVAKPEKGGKE